MARTLTAKRARTILWGKLDWHPAVNAWIAFADGAGMPDTIEVLRDGKQSATYRLVGAGPNGESVIAQRVQGAWAVGRTLYERVLRHLPLPAPRYGGFPAGGPPWGPGVFFNAFTGPHPAEAVGRWGRGGAEGVS